MLSCLKVLSTHKTNEVFVLSFLRPNSFNNTKKMGCTGSAPEASKEDIAKSKSIDANLRKDKKNIESEIKLLLLGAGESGKSTIAKQMKIIYLRGFSDNERRPYREIIFSNIIMSMRSLVLAVDKFGEQVAEENREKAKLFKSNTILFEQTISPEVQDAIASLWKDPIITNAFKRSAEFQLNDSAGSYVSHFFPLSLPFIILLGFFD